MKEKSDKVVMAAIAGLTIIESIALFKGVDGVLLTVIVAAIAGAAGWVGLPQPKFMDK